MDLTTRILVYGFLIVVPVMLVIALVRFVQLAILLERERGSLFGPMPDTPAVRQWRHVNVLIFCSIVLSAGLASTCFAAVTSWQSFHAGNAEKGWLYALSTAFAAFSTVAFGAYPIWYSLRQRP
jgi:hypothetical protein